MGMSSTDRINWGILSTGAIARTFARGLAASTTGRLVAVASRSIEKAEQFGQEFHVPREGCLGSYDDLIADKSVHAIYIATPHPQHTEWAIKGAGAGKHLLVEKPLAINHGEGMAIVEAAIATDVALMEAFMYRCHPQTSRLVELLRENAIGQVRMIQASFGFHAGFNAESRAFNNALAGGGILDVGCYPVSIARLIAGVAGGKDFAEPIDVKAAGHLGSSGVDEWTAAVLKFPGDIIAQVSTSVSLNQENVVRIFGSEGTIYLPTPWVMNRTTPEQGRIIVSRRGDSSPRELSIDADVTSFTYEADVFGQLLLSGARQAPPPAMSWQDTLGNLRTLDRWRDAIGLVYESEKPAAHRETTVYGVALAVAPGQVMTYGKIAGVEKPVSRLIMGCDNQPNFPHACVMFDDFFARGGNTFDTAHIYGGGHHERLLGQWISKRGLREQVVVVAKGAHTPYCTPTDLKLQLKMSLERMQLDYADIYLMHRDNLDIPVGEFVDALNEEIAAGRIRAIGGSNWTLSRVDQANEYARSKSLTPFAVVSNNFSLARMVDAPWAGCISASDADSRAWFEKTQTALLSWSSQARGFFIPEIASPQKRSDAEPVRCWYSDDNFQRQARVMELAGKLGVSPINVALAYVLHQPCPTFALIGPRQLSETRTSLAGLTVHLSPAQVKWLNLETDAA
jgi:predicted dehydrogenase/aryl-alcohol dehydrogenase-like predicted oxidoreductase